MRMSPLLKRPSFLSRWCQRRCCRCEAYLALPAGTRSAFTDCLPRLRLLLVTCPAVVVAQSWRCRPTSATPATSASSAPCRKKAWSLTTTSARCAPPVPTALTTRCGCYCQWVFPLVPPLEAVTAAVFSRSRIVVATRDKPPVCTLRVCFRRPSTTLAITTRSTFVVPRTTVACRRGLTRTSTVSQCR